MMWKWHPFTHLLKKLIVQMISFGHMRHVHYCLKASSFLLFLGSACGLQITSTGPTSIEKASGETVKLDCQFTLAAEDSGPLDIEWSLQPSDNQKEEKVVSRQCDCVSGYEIWLVSVWERLSLYVPGGNIFDVCIIQKPLGGLVWLCPLCSIASLPVTSSCFQQKHKLSELVWLPLLCEAAQ